MKSSDTTLIKMVEVKYEALDGIYQGGIIYLKIALDKMFNMSDLVITSIQEFFKNFSQDGVSKHPSETWHLFSRRLMLWQNGWQRYRNFQGICLCSSLLASPSEV